MQRSLRRLARLYGVQSSYEDMAGNLKEASTDALLQTLKALGAPLEGPGDIPAALRERRLDLWQRLLPPVVVAWEGRPIDIALRLPPSQAESLLDCRLELEGGNWRTWKLDLGQLPSRQAAEVEGVRFVSKTLTLPGPLPWGYHRLWLDVAGAQFQTLILSAPTRAYSLPQDPSQGRTWGGFLPLYALHTARSWGCGDLKDLEALLEWIDRLGGKVVATLPFLAAFLDEPLDPSPYAPISRLFWNEMYLDIASIPELERSPSARAIVGSPAFERELRALRSSPQVEHRRQMALKREALSEMARCFFSEPPAPERRAAFQVFLAEQPRANDYAIFRATCERQRTPWRQWPQPLCDGILSGGDYDEEAKGYHLYVQWLMREQLQDLTANTRRAGQRLYLDLPLGVHPDGYDVWRERHAFVSDVSAGAPPDAFFSKGQDWAFPPLHPEGIRKLGYGYYIECLRHHLRHAGILRLDHVMGLHRLFWVPKGFEPSQGVYVRYPAEEFYAVLALESHKYEAVIVGEDLGTVPSYVRSAMARHNLRRMYVLQFEVPTDDPSRPLNAPTADAVASLNTHDTPTFAAFWDGVDIEDRLALGLLDREGILAERETREAQKEALAGFLRRAGLLQGAATAREVLQASLAHLAGSQAEIVLVNLEDLWLETQPQNVPGTSHERSNWQRKASHSLEEFRRMSPVIDMLREINNRRNGLTQRRVSQL